MDGAEEGEEVGADVWEGRQEGLVGAGVPVQTAEALLGTWEAVVQSMGVLEG